LDHEDLGRNLAAVRAAEDRQVGGDAARPTPRELLLTLAHLLQVVAALHESVDLGDACRAPW
jgi:hypothetical protein